MEAELPALQFVRAQRHVFWREGYLVVPSFLDPGEVEKFGTALMRIPDGGGKDLSLLPEFDHVVTAPKFCGLAAALLGPTWCFHHANGRACRTRVRPKAWHHDHDGESGQPEGMVHVLVYPLGLGHGAGELAVLPRSHRFGVDRAVPNCRGTDQLKGEVVIHGGQGLAVIIYSALWHCRRPGELDSGEVRLDFNVSYCRRHYARPERRSYRARFERLVSRLGPIAALEE